jgi:hypothetical protein
MKQSWFNRTIDVQLAKGRGFESYPGLLIIVFFLVSKNTVVWLVMIFGLFALKLFCYLGYENYIIINKIAMLLL